MENKRHSFTSHALWPTEGTLPLSVAIVCKDARSTIARTVRSVRGLAREVVVLDSGSTDGTVQLLHRMGINAQHQNWLGYIAQKNCVLGMCRHDWILCLDSDESLEPDLREAVLAAVKANDPAVGGYEMNRKVHYKGAWLHHAWQPEWRLRLVRRGEAKWVGYDPHDELVLAAPSGSVGGRRAERLVGTMRHDSIESIADFLSKQCRHGRTAASALHKRAKRGSVLSLVTSPVGAWLKQMVARSAWRDGWRGWGAAGAAAVAALAKHAALLEVERSPHEGPGNAASRSASGADPNASSVGHDTPTHTGEGHA